MEGSEIIRAAIDLVRQELRREPSGLTNAEIGERTDPNLPVSAQRGYITWTIPRYLVETGEVRKDERVYRLIRA